MIKEPTLKQKRIAIYGIDRPMPKVKGKVKVANALGSTINNNVELQMNNDPRFNDPAHRVYGRCNLNAGSALAKRFPRHAR